MDFTNEERDTLLSVPDSPLYPQGTQKKDIARLLAVSLPASSTKIPNSKAAGNTNTDGFAWQQRGGTGTAPKGSRSNAASNETSTLEGSEEIPQTRRAFGDVGHTLSLSAIPCPPAAFLPLGQSRTSVRLLLSATLTIRGLRMLIMRTSRGGDRRRKCSPVTRQGGLRGILLGAADCNECCEAARLIGRTGKITEEACR